MALQIILKDNAVAFESLQVHHKKARGINIPRAFPIDLTTLLTTLYQKVEQALCFIFLSSLFSIPRHTKKAPGAICTGGLYYFLSCFTAWSRPVAARPDATPTAAAVMGSVAGKSGMPT